MTRTEKKKWKKSRDEVMRTFIFASKDERDRMLAVAKELSAKRGAKK